ncbi:MAG: hypothetical protein M1828_004980 [Chrysothrix sp. TS-e1954]|nr:MAG: hypothetical protein M1828_004980 [Chrysothrix sp. TS-e1954]
MASAATSAWVSSTRPLSDIREITEPSLLNGTQRKPISIQGRIQDQHAASSSNWPSCDSARPTSRQSAHARPLPRASSRKGRQQVPVASNTDRLQAPQHGAGSPNKVNDQGTVYSIPSAVIPPRSSSRPRLKPSGSFTRLGSQPSTPRRNASRITNRRKLHSPIKNAELSSLANGAQGHPFPSKTIVKSRNGALYDILDHPIHLHPRLKVNICVAAPLFVGGSSVEGTVRIVIDEAERSRHRKALTLERACVDLMGIEEVSGAKRNIFLALANELIDTTNPQSTHAADTWRGTPPGRSWILVPSVSNLPFLITLPLEVGPPPFQSKHAKIRYTLSATLTIKDEGRLLSVRSSQDVTILSVYDPEKALVSLPSPLTASDEYVLQQGSGNENILVTAGLHRQVWVSGTDIFADVQIINNSRKTIKRIELQLERIILCYRHAAASTLEMSASGARLFDQLDRTIVRKATVKRGVQGWTGVLPYSTDLRTCDLEIPRGHATIKCKKYFEVRYYLNVIAGTSHMNVVTVQLPIILIHMNSLDVPTNSVAQVAAAIDEKRGVGQTLQKTSVARESPRAARSASRNQMQGRAFSAPRKASSERQHWLREQREHQNRAGTPSNHSSPRNRRSLAVERNKDRVAASAPIPQHPTSPPQQQAESSLYRNGSFSFQTPPSNRNGRLILEDDAEQLRRRFGHIRNSMSLGTNTTAQHTCRSGVSGPPRASSAMGRPSFATAGEWSAGKKSVVSQRSLNFAKPPLDERRKPTRRKPGPLPR